MGVPIRRDDRPSGTNLLRTITYGDCIADEFIEFGVTIGGSVDSTSALEVWAGTSDACDDEDERSMLTPEGCWQVLVGEPITQTIRVSVRDMIPHGESGPGTAPDDICDTATNNNLTLFFMVLNGSDLEGSDEDQFEFDFVGPEPPDLTGLGAGEGRLIARWDASEDTDIFGYRVYCEPSGAPVVPDDAGAGGDSADPPTGDCSAPTLVAGQRPPSELRRGTAGQTADEAPATGLTNFQEYACGVAAFDEEENLGNLSQLLCATPEPVRDYFEAYRAAGGQAGGGFCAFGRGPADAGAAIFGLAGLLLAVRRRLARGGAR